MRLIRMLLLTVLSFTSVAAMADDEVAVQRLTELLNQAQTINARFSQLTLDGSGTQLQETAGQLALKRPGLFRWHTDAPMEQLLVSNGEKVWLYDPDLQQVTIQTLDQRLTHTPFRNKVLNDMQLIDSIGQRTNILFLNVKMNEPQDDAQFTFEIPAGADVIQE